MPELQGLDDKSNVRIDIKNMNDYRHDDLMFINYLNKTENTIRQAFRLPPLYIGSSQEYSFATSYSSQQIAEEQVFNPERLVFDEIINNKIIRPEFGSQYWIYRTKGPRVGSADQLRMVVKELVNAGALSVDNTIQIANELLGTQFSPYETEWSKMPAAFVRAMIQSGRMVLNEDGTLSFFSTPSDTGNPASHLNDGTNPVGR
jgi:capsid portal protein